MAKLAETVITLSKDGYPELDEKKDMIFKVLSEEEDKFNKTIDQGLNILSDLEEKLNAEAAKSCPARMRSVYMIPTDSRWI